MQEKSFFLSVKAMIQNADDCFLLVKRSQESKANAGKWELPGGKVNPSEDFDVALLREVMEETGLTISLIRPVGIAESDMPNKMIVYLILEGVYRQGEVVLSSEHDDYVWAKSEDIPKMDIVKQLRPFIESYCTTNS